MSAQQVTSSASQRMSEILLCCWGRGKNTTHSFCILLEQLSVAGSDDTVFPAPQEPAAALAHDKKTERGKIHYTIHYCFGMFKISHCMSDCNHKLTNVCVKFSTDSVGYWIPCTLEHIASVV